MKISRRLQFWACALFLYGCGGGSVGPNGHVVGAQCASDRDCANRCALDGDFGNGMCTRFCAIDADCPSGSVCVSTDGGICAVACHASSDCSGFGRAFVCASKSRPTGGSVLVCRVP